VIESESDVAEFGEGVGPPTLEVVQPGPFRSDQDRRPEVGTARQSQVSDHRQAVRRILDRTRGDRHEFGL